MAISENKKLLAAIAPYEGGDVPQGPSRRLLMEDQGVAVQMMRGFVKERYWWEWVRLATKTLP